MTSFLAQRACGAAVLYQARLVPELLEPTDKTTMGEPVGLSIRLATTGELLGQWTSAEVERPAGVGAQTTPVSSD